MKASMIVFGLGLSLLTACASKSDSKKSPGAVETPQPIGNGFFFIDSNAAEIPVYVRGDMNGWLGGEVSAETLEAAKLSFNEDSGCYAGAMELAAGDYNFKLATYLPTDANSGWSFLKFGLGSAGSSTEIEIGSEVKADVYYFPAGDAEGKDAGGGGNFLVSIPENGKFDFKLCTNPADYTAATFILSKK